MEHMKTKPTCRWIISPLLTFPVQHCDAPITWTMVRDDDGNLVRKNKIFCQEHQALVDAEDELESNILNRKTAQGDGL